MGYQAKESIAYLVKESSEGVPAFPASAVEAIALQEAPNLEPGNSILTVEEFVGGVDKGEDLAGPETPTLSLNHYLRHSGIEGQSPNYALLLEMAFGGAATPAEKTTAAGSTAGDATNRAELAFADAIGLETGRPFLIKDASLTGGYQIRCAHEISGNNAKLNFNLPGAPATGIATGQLAPFLRPDSTHPTASFHDLRANEAAYQVARGMRVISYSAEATAEELINQSFTLEGLELFLNPVRATATQKYIDFTDSLGTVQAVLDEKVYSTPETIAEAIASRMTQASAGSAGDIITCVWDSLTGKFTIASNGTVLSLLWNTGAQAANTIGAAIGFNTAADDTGFLTYTSDNEQDYTSQGMFGFDPVVDDNTPLIAVNNEILLSPVEDFDNFLCFSTRSITFNINNTKATTQDMCEPTGKSGTSITLREPGWTITANLKKHETRFYDALKRAKDVACQWVAGEKDGSGWIPGKNFVVYSRQAKVSGHIINTTDEEVTVELTLSGFGKGATKKSVFGGFL